MPDNGTDEQLRDCVSRTAQQVIDLSAGVREGFLEIKAEADDLDDRLRGVESQVDVLRASRKACIERHGELREGIRQEAATDRAAIRKEMAAALVLCQTQRDRAANGVTRMDKIRKAGPTIAVGAGSGGIVLALIEFFKWWIQYRGGLP